MNASFGLSEEKPEWFKKEKSFSNDYYHPLQFLPFQVLKLPTASGTIVLDSSKRIAEVKKIDESNRPTQLRQLLLKDQSNFT